MEPAATIIAALGGSSAVTAITGAHRTRVWKWTQPREKGGTGGLIPQKYHLLLLDHAASHGVALQPADFLPPRALQPTAA